MAAGSNLHLISHSIHVYPSSPLPPLARPDPIRLIWGHWLQFKNYAPHGLTLPHGTSPHFRPQGQVDILKLLLEAGGERLRSCGALQAALNWAACFGRVAVMELLAPSNPNHP